MKRDRFEVAPEDHEWFGRVGWHNVEAVLAHRGGDTMAVNQSSNVVRVPVESASGETKYVYLKRYLYHHRSQRIKQMFRGTLLGPSRARREYEFLKEMRRRRVPTVRPMAYGEQRRGLFVRACFVITQGCDGGRSLDLFALDHLRDQDLSRVERITLITTAAQTIRQMHGEGVRHGGLFWRNILVRVQTDGSFRFMLLDPDTQGRMFDSTIPASEAVVDLAEFVASGMALGWRRGLGLFLRTYFGVPRLDSEQRRMVSHIVERARRLARGEQQRMAVTEMIDWLRRRAAGGDGPSSDRSRGIRSLDDFFNVLTSGPATTAPRSETKRTIHFSFAAASRTSAPLEQTVIMQNGRFTVGSGNGSKPDLMIQTDVQTWLAVLAGSKDAFARVQAGGLRLEGDARLLPIVAERIDG